MTDVPPAAYPSFTLTRRYLHGGWFSLVGPTAIRSMSQVYAGKAFLGCNGVHAECDISAYHPDEGALFCQVQDVHLLITDTGASDEAIAGFLTNNIEVRRV